MHEMPGKIKEAYPGIPNYTGTNYIFYETAKVREDPGEQLEEVRQLPWADLLSRLQSGQLSALTALTAYQAAALEVAEKTNCVTQWLQEAGEEARRLDQLPPDARGPLHGVPVSVKECYEVAGTFATAGMAVFAR